MCPNCAAVRSGDPELEARTQSSVAVSADGETWALLNASPDITFQLQRNRALHPRPSSGAAGRQTPIRTVLITNGDVDHLTGLIGLREAQAFRVLATAEILGVIEANPIFGVLNRSLVHFEAIRLDEAFDLVPGITARVFAVPGKVPLYLEGAEVKTDLVGEQTVGVELSGPGGVRAYYIPGCARVDDALRQRVEGAALLMFDGTLFSDDEMIRLGVGVKTGARMGHISMGGPSGSLAAWAGCRIGRRVYVHINNTNPALRNGSRARREIEAAGWEVGRDGMEIEP